MHIQKHIADYFDRPETLNDLTLTAFLERYETTRRKKKQYKAEEINTRGYVTKKRSNKKTILLDLKFYSSPATRLNARWCLDAMILHVPHRSIRDLVLQDCDYTECAIHFQNFIEQRNAEGKPMYSELVKYENTMIDLDSSTKTHPSSNPLSTASAPVAKPPKKSDCTTNLTEEEYPDDDEDEVEASFNEMQAATDPDEYFNCAINANTDLSKNVDTIHLWNGICDTNVSEYLRAALGTDDNFAEMNDNVLQMDN